MTNNDEAAFINVLNFTRKMRIQQAMIQAHYENDVFDWYHSGDGRSPEWVDEVVFGDDGEPVDVARYNVGGKGYAYPECIHGTSRWTDYDNICGGCEGDYDWQFTLHTAVLMAKGYADQFTHRMNVLMELPIAQFDEAAKAVLNDWVFWPMGQCGYVRKD